MAPSAFCTAGRQTNAHLLLVGTRELEGTIVRLCIWVIASQKRRVFVCEIDRDEVFILAIERPLTAAAANKADINEYQSY